MNRNYFLRIFAIVLLILFISFIGASKNQEISDTQNTTFNIPSSRNVESGEIVVNGDFESINISFNNEILNNVEGGIVKQIESNFFKEGENLVEFFGNIDDFKLTYFYTVGEEGSCSNDNHCTEGICIGGSCCSEDYPIHLSSSVSESCSGSAIPVIPEKSCEGITSSDNISIYLNNVLIDDDCNISGDADWGIEIDGEYVDRCGSKIPADFDAGTYKLMAKYNINGKEFEKVLNENFDVSSKCDVSSRCQHGGSIYGREVEINDLSEKNNEIFKEGSNSYIVPKGSNLNYSGVSSFIGQCSNGYRTRVRPIVVSWIYAGPTVLDVSENMDCDIKDSIQNLIGSKSSKIGYNPGCDLHWRMFGSSSYDVFNFEDSGEYTIKTYNVNAVCDAPDYICPDLYESDKYRSNICRIGTMNHWWEADGWRYIKEDNVKVVGQEELNVTFNLDAYSDSFWNYNIENVGNAKADVQVSSVGSLGNFEINCSQGNCIKEGLSVGDKSALSFGISLKDENKEEKNMNVGGASDSITYEYLSLGDIKNSYVMKDKIILEFPVVFEYDDSYSFSSIVPVEEDLPLNFSYVCNGSNNYVLNLSGEEYYCFGNNFQNTAPYAWIVEPEQNEDIFGNTSNFAAIAFDNSTDFDNLEFSWFFRKDDVSEEFPEEPYYQNKGILGSNFSRYFSWRGDKQVMLKVKDSENNVKEDVVNFSLLFEEQEFSVSPACSEDGRKWIIPEGKDVSSMNQCRNINSLNVFLCCPRNYRCLENEGNWSCIPQNSNNSQEGGINFCSEYDSETNCTMDPRRVGIFSVESSQGEGFCGSYDSLVDGCNIHNTCQGCIWNNSENKCYSDYSVKKDCPSSSETISVGECKIESQMLSSCEKGASLYEIKYSYQWEGSDAPDNCKGERTKKIPCPSKIKLSFVNYFSLLSAFLIIFGIYYVKNDSK